MIAAEIVNLPAFYRLRWVAGRCHILTLKGEIVATLAGDTAREHVEAIARAHNEVRHWAMIAREAEKDESPGSVLFAHHAREKLEKARGECQRAMSQVEEGAA